MGDWRRGSGDAFQTNHPKLFTPDTSVTDGELITAARAGDTSAWGELYARWLPWVWRYAYSLVGDRHVAEDVTSEAMTAWVRRLNESEAEAAQLAGWLRTVIRNKSADHVRRVTRLRRAVAGVSEVRRDATPEAPATPLERDETRQQVRETLHNLPERHQLVLEWKYSEGLSVRQIAERMGTTEKSVEASLYRARKEFRRRFESTSHCSGDSPVNDSPPNNQSPNDPGLYRINNLSDGALPVVATETEFEATNPLTPDDSRRRPH